MNSPTCCFPKPGDVFKNSATDLGSAIIGLESAEVVSADDGGTVNRCTNPTSHAAWSQSFFNGLALKDSAILFSRCFITFRFRRTYNWKK